MKYIVLGVTGGILLVPSLGTNLTQSKVSSGSAEAAGMIDTNEFVFFRATVSDSGAENTRLDVEVQPLGVAFTNTASASSPLVTSGNIAEAMVTLTTGVPVQGYHWQARSRNASGAVTAWVSFGGNAETDADFIIDLTPPEPTNLQQVMIFGGAIAGPGAIDTNGDVFLSADHDDPESESATHESEVRKLGEPYTGVA
jgi:hypothetical protein